MVHAVGRGTSATPATHSYSEDAFSGSNPANSQDSFISTSGSILEQWQQGFQAGLKWVGGMIFGTAACNPTTGQPPTKAPDQAPETRASGEKALPPSAPASPAISCISIEESAQGEFHAKGKDNPLYSERYERVYEFQEDLAVVRQNGKEFHIRQDGTPLYAAKFDAVGTFSEDAAVALIGDQWFHINKDGQALYPERFTLVEPFHDGAAVAVQDGKWFHIGKDGKPLYAARFDSIQRFREGSAPAKLNGKWFHIGTDGKPLYAQRFDSVDPFNEGAAAVRDHFQGFHIKQDGAPLYKQRYYVTGKFTDGAAAAGDVNLGRDNIFYIRPNGERLHSGNYQIGYYYKNGVAKVEPAGGSPIYIDKQGKEVAPPQGVCEAKERKGEPVNESDREEGIRWMDRNLWNAAANADMEGVKQALKDGADIDFIGRNKHNAVILAARRNDHAMVRYLIDRGANVNSKSPWGYSPLMAAVWYADVEMLKLFVKNGADLYATNSLGSNALDFAKGGHVKKYIYLCEVAEKQKDQCECPTVCGPESQAGNPVRPGGTVLID